MRLIFTENVGSGIFRLFGGAGYRFADPADRNALLGEAGLGFAFGRLGLGAGAKYLKYEKDQSSDTNYFISVSGGAGFSFGL